MAFTHIGAVSQDGCTLRQLVVLVGKGADPPLPLLLIAGGGTKLATLETGATLQVPNFIEEGSKIKIDARIGTYLSKA